MLNLLSSSGAQSDFEVLFYTVIAGFAILAVILIAIIVKLSQMSAAGVSKEVPAVGGNPISGRNNTSDNYEIIAVIAAAVAAIGAEEGKTLRITDIRKKEKPLRSHWGQAGIIANTAPKM